jgi:predicted permease
VTYLKDANANEVEASGADPSPSPKVKLVDYVARELLYQGYVASRLTGMTPSNMRRAIGSATRSKYLIALPFAFLLLLIMAEARFLPLNGYLTYPIGVLIWTFMPVFISVMQISYGASAGPQIRDTLLTLPLSDGDVKTVASGALISSLKIPLLVSVAILLIAGLVLGPWLMLAGILAAVLSTALALIAVSAIVRAYRRLGTNSRLSTLIRIITVIPILLFSLVLGYVQSSKVQISFFQATYVPVLNLDGVAQGHGLALIISLVYTVPVAIVGYVAFRRTSVALLSPLTFFASRRGSFRAMVRPPITALVLSDFRQMLRSPRLVGFIIVPFIYVIITIYSSVVSAQSGAAESYPALFISSVLPVAAISSFLAYVLYLTELRGLSYFMTLPLGRFTNVKSKLAVTILFYGVSAALLGVTFTAVTGNADLFIPIVAFMLTVVACVLYTALYFHYTVKSMALGVLGFVNTVVYTIVNLIVFGIPAASFVVALFLYGNFVYPTLILAGSSLIEIAILLLLLVRAS